MYDTGLANRIRAKGVRVVEIAGWQTRGNGSGFQPRGAIHHHTAGSSRGAIPSLNTNIYGRPDVPGPLAQVMQSREPDALDKAYVIAAGKCNHGGVGHWNNPATGELINSNYESEGLEVEHTGTGAVDPARHEISCRILAAMLEAPGSSRDWRMCCEHYEYADPDGRKVDFRELNPPFANRAAGIRARVGYWIGRTITTPPPVPIMEELPEMFLYKGPGPAFFFCHAGKSVGINEASDLATFTDADVPVLRLDDDTFAKFRAAFPGS